jgi:hypothetical protein
MALAKLLITVEHTGARFTVLFNPEEYTLNTDNAFASQAIPGLSAPLLQFVNGGTRTLEMELFFDTYDSASARKRDVRGETDKVARLMAIDPELHAPPVLRVSWASLQFRCVLVRVSQRFVMFAEDGTPVRARLTTTFNELVDPEREAKQIKRETATFSKVHVVARGETLSGIAGRLYENPGMWRPLAIANRIDDPRSIAVGQRLLVPSLPFADPDTGETLR